MNVPDHGAGLLLRTVKPQLESLNSARFFGAAGHIFPFAGSGWSRQALAFENKAALILIGLL